MRCKEFETLIGIICLPMCANVHPYGPMVSDLSRPGVTNVGAPGRLQGPSRSPTGLL